MSDAPAMPADAQEHALAQPGDPGYNPAHHESHVHVVPLSMLFGIFAALIVLTWATVAVTSLDFGYTGNLVVAMVVATIKAALVALYFMHLRWDKPFHGIIVISSIAFVALFIIFALFDANDYQELIEQRSYQQAPSQLPGS